MRPLVHVGGVVAQSERRDYFTRPSALRWRPAVQPTALPSARQCRQREGLSLCTSFCHTATAYKEANDLEAAVNACESAAELMRELEASDDSAPEERTVVKLDLLFRQIEVTVPCCTSEEERQRTHALLNEARTIISSITSESADNSTGAAVTPSFAAFVSAPFSLPSHACVPSLPMTC